MDAFLNFRAIEAGDPCTVVFGDSVPDLPCTFQRFITDGGTVVVTTPVGETDVSLQVTHYIDDYKYIRAGQ